jgi:hypothetical protein
MDLREGYLSTNLTCGETDDPPANPSISPLSYVHRFIPVRLTTEVKLHTQELEPSTWKEHPYMETQNTYDAATVLRPTMTPTVVPHLAGGATVSQAAFPVTVLRLQARPASDQFFFPAFPVVGEDVVAEVSDLREALPESRRVLSANDHVASIESWIADDLANVPSSGATYKGPHARLLLQQLKKMARERLGELSTAIAHFRGELDRLTRVALQPAAALRPVPVRGQASPPTAQEPECVKGEVLNQELNMVESLRFPLSREAGIRKGQLVVALGAPEELIGQVAAIFLTTGDSELLLGILPIEHGTEGSGKLRLTVDLASVGVEAGDGVLPPAALRVVVRRQPAISERDTKAA